MSKVHARRRRATASLSKLAPAAGLVSEAEHGQALLRKAKTAALTRRRRVRPRRRPSAVTFAEQRLLATCALLRSKSERSEQEQAFATRKFGREAGACSPSCSCSCSRSAHAPARRRVRAAPKGTLPVNGACSALLSTPRTSAQQSSATPSGAAISYAPKG